MITDELLQTVLDVVRESATSCLGAGPVAIRDTRKVVDDIILHVTDRLALETANKESRPSIEQLQRIEHGMTPTEWWTIGLPYLDGIQYAQFPAQERSAS
jgi:hypothetical protein